MALGLRKLVRFWATALGWQVVNRGGYGVLIGTGDGSSEIDLRSVPDGPKPVRNRPAKSRPVSRDRAVELDGLLALGARRGFERGRLTERQPAGTHARAA